MITDAQHGVTAAVVEVCAHGEVGTEDVAITLLRDLLTELRGEAGEVPLGDEVDNTRHGVGTVCHRSAAREDVKAIKQSNRNVVQIDSTALVGGHNANTVDENNVAVRTEATKVDRRGAVVAVVNLLANAGDDAGNFAKRLFRRVGLAKLKLVLTNCRNRR